MARYQLSMPVIAFGSDQAADTALSLHRRDAAYSAKTIFAVESFEKCFPGTTGGLKEWYVPAPHSLLEAGY
ncbi:MAG: hypothetical protein R3C24_11010 [Cyanobacteriota/Melainabacteria group bacterium]